MAEEELRAQIFLVVEAGEGARERLASALGAGVTSVLITPSAQGTFDAATLAPLIQEAQAAGAAALVYNDASLAHSLKADGVHIPQSPNDALAEQYEAARKTLGSQAIIGVGVGASRHDAMTLGEAGADYIAFGLASDTHDYNAARIERQALITWWAEIFEPPCVALDVETPTDAQDLAKAGADFIGVTLPGGISPAQAAERVTVICTAISAMATA